MPPSSFQLKLNELPGGRLDIVLQYSVELSQGPLHLFYSRAYADPDLEEDPGERTLLFQRSWDVAKFIISLSWAAQGCNGAEWLSGIETLEPDAV